MDEERHVKALESVRDVTKQLVTIDAALLTFGLAVVKDITRGDGPTSWFVVAIVSLLIGVVTGSVALFAAVGQTHEAHGTINARSVRWSLILSLIALVVGVGAIGIYITKAPIRVT